MLHLRRRNAKPKNGREEDAQERAFRVLSRIRRNKESLNSAARAENTDTATVDRYVGSALRKVRGRYVAAPRDTILRTIHIHADKYPDKIAVTVRGPVQARIGSGHANAVQRYRDIGDSSGLMKFEGQYITDARGNKYLLLTDTHELDRRARKGRLSFESLYARSA